MASLSDGARQLPVRHLSIRVPWHDSGWAGCVCKKPADNVSCLILRRIREKRDDEHENKLAGKPWSEIDENKLPPCVSERCSFMSPREFTLNPRHPYSQTSDAHKHLMATPFRYPAYSAACLPFAWMLKDLAEEKYTALELGFDPEREDRAHDIMGFKTVWIQTKHNQLVMLDTFFSAVQPQKSLCFIYAKRVPLVEDSRRVIIGVGWVDHVGKPVEYKYKKRGEIDSVLWERSVQHSIRPKFKNGFLLPYHEILKYLKNNPEEDPAQYVAFAPDEHFWSYCYASEHLTNDGAIASLLSCNKALENIRKVKTGLRGFDTDLETPGIQYGEDMGDFTRTMLESVERTVAENPKKALDMLLTRVPTAEQQDVKAEKIIKKAIQTESRRIEKEEIKDLREEQKQIRTDWNTKVQNKIDAVQENLKNTGFKETEVAKFTAKITKTAKGDIANVEEMTKQTANTIYQLHNRMSDADIPATADDLFDAIEDVEKVGNRKMIKKAEADLVLAKSTGNEDLIDSAQDALEVAKNTTTKDLVDIEKQRLADWWLRNTNKVGTLDVDKFWEMPSGSRQKTRKDAMTNMISLYFTLKQGSPTVQESIAIESDLDLDEDINALLDISKSGE